MFDVRRIEAEHSLEANYLKVKCPVSEQVDEIALKVIRNDKPEFLLPMRTIMINNTTELRYTMGNQIALAYSNLMLRKDQFLNLYQGLLVPFVRGNDWMLDYHHFCIDLGHVFIDKNGKDVYFLYIPTSEGRNTDDEIIEFFRTVLNKVTVTDDTACLLKLYQSFSRGNITLSELYNIVSKEMAGGVQPIEAAPKLGSVPKPEPRTNPVNADPVQTLPPVQVSSVAEKKEEVPQKQNPNDNFIMSVFNGSEPKKKSKGGLFGGKHHKEPEQAEPFVMPSQSIENASDDEVMNALFGSSKKNEKKNKKKGFAKKGEDVPVQRLVTAPLPGANPQSVQSTPMQPVKPFSQKVEPAVAPEAPVQQPMSYDYTNIETETDVTEIEGSQERLMDPHLELVNMGLPGIPAMISLQFAKEQIMIGRQSNDNVQPDIRFSSEYKKIGRMHACIRKEAAGYYLVDLGSANGTTLNGQVLVPNQPYLLHSQDVIGFVAIDPIQYKVIM